MILSIKTRLMKSRPEKAYENILEHLRYIGAVNLLEWKREGDYLKVDIEVLASKEWVQKYAIPRIRSFLDEVEIKGD